MNRFIPNFGGFRSRPGDSQNAANDPAYWQRQAAAAQNAAFIEYDPAHGIPIIIREPLNITYAPPIAHCAYCRRARQSKIEVCAGCGALECK